MKTRTHAYTFIELSMSMSVFSIVLLTAMKLLTTSQNITTKVSSTMEMFQNARIFFELISRDLHSVYYADNKIPFWYKGESSNLVSPQYNNELLAFVSNTKASSNSDRSFCEVKYTLWHDDSTLTDTSGWIMRSVTGDSSSKHNYMNNITAAFTDSTQQKAFTANDDSSEEYRKLIPCVLDLKFKCYKSNNDDLIAGNDSATCELPRRIEVYITLLDRKTWDKWVGFDNSICSLKSGPLHYKIDESAEARAFREINQMTFSKIIYLGDRT